MALYHLNYELGKPERCTAMVSCPHGDLDSAHFTTVEELKAQMPTMGPSLTAFKRVREMSACLDWAGTKGPVNGLPEARREVASVSYALGRLAAAPGEEDRERFRQALLRLQEALLRTLQPDNDDVSHEARIELVKAINIMAEVGSAGNRI